MFEIPEVNDGITLNFNSESKFASKIVMWKKNLGVTLGNFDVIAPVNIKKKCNFCTNN